MLGALLFRHCGTYISDSKIDAVERAFRDMRLSSSLFQEYARTIYADLHFHVIYENQTLEGGYVPYPISLIILLTFELITCAETNKSMIKSTS
jgi:hypothetical protein